MSAPEITVWTHDGECGPSCNKPGRPVVYIREDLARGLPFWAKVLASIPGTVLAMLMGFGFAKGWFV